MTPTSAHRAPRAAHRGPRRSGLRRARQSAQGAALALALLVTVMGAEPGASAHPGAHGPHSPPGAVAASDEERADAAPGRTPWEQHTPTPSLVPADATGEAGPTATPDGVLSADPASTSVPGDAAPEGGAVAGSTAAGAPQAGGAARQANGCAAQPSACGYPDASTTGVPAGTVLRAVPQELTSGPGWHYDERGWIVVDGDGAVLEGITTTATVEVTGRGAVVRASQIVVAGEANGVALRHAQDVTIEDCEISGPTGSGPQRLLVGIKDVYGDATGAVIRRNDIWHTSTGVQIDSGLIEGNYIHDLGLASGDHLNGTTSGGGTAQLTIRGNTILNPHPQTDAVSLFQDFGPQANRLIEGNLLAGGGYTLYAGANSGKESTATNISVIGNRFARSYYAQAGSYGPVTAYTSGGGNKWSGNVWDDDGSTIPTPHG
ncbi:right-handed parallel beta-helix repeat-containing protein [Cellulomonas cellasea]|uniref:right-handed parallel beta-helix repeat-containing protein n=1 Tax=Cellulomonas cellasea TaxID=43670 RepID=UPI0025A43A88|nr:right-handed parallel beta-helix repeat-containing protein [Cellulomonas cellasea]MDM8083229.1 right-handed parallel beta-helix repeat-containing protein [Cellulomonas cellasea]